MQAGNTPVLILALAVVDLWASSWYAPDFEFPRWESQQNAFSPSQIVSSIHPTLLRVTSNAGSNRVALPWQVVLPST